MWNTVRTWAAQYGNNQPTRWKGKSRRGKKKKQSSTKRAGRFADRQTGAKWEQNWSCSPRKKKKERELIVRKRMDGMDG